MKIKDPRPKQKRPPDRSTKILYGVLAVCSLITIGSFLWPEKPKNALDPNLGITDPEASRNLFLRQQEDHPVTDEMLDTAEKLGAKKAPDFTLIDTEGKPHSLKSLAEGKPLLIFFVEKECPCCLGAKHFVDSLAMMYKDSANVIGIINATGEVAQTWIKTTTPHFLVLQDPEQKVIRAYQAERGVYTTIVAPDGTINKAYAGYSLEMLQDASSRLAKLAGVKDQGFESPAAPTKLTSGCLFPEVPTKTTNSSEKTL
ncbi:MAG: redoxin domain-containing protein [Fimbriimonadaceae bacterium]|nr:MAG: redoxin domain-containing protein [Fimbriimonadaceae bacterium]